MAAATLLVADLLRPAPAAAPLTRFVLNPPPEEPVAGRSFGPSLAIAPDVTADQLSR